MHVVGASAAIWITTIILAFYVNPIMDWLKKNQKSAASSTSEEEIESVTSSSGISPLSSEKGVSLAGKTFRNAPGKGTSSWWGNGPKERTGSQKAGDSNV